jgi:Tfp pilus assembly protein FimT
LLETVIAMALATSVASLGAVELVRLVSGARLAGAARTTAGTLRLARGMAIARGAGIEARFDPAARTFELRDRADLLVRRHTLPAGIEFAALPARRRILFGGLGTADNGTITLAAGSRLRSIVVNQRGRVRVQ